MIRLQTIITSSVVGFLLMTVSVCDQQADGTHPSPSPTDSSAAPSSSSDATANVYTDPRELAAYVARQAQAGNWAALQPLLAADYQTFSYGIGNPLDHYSPLMRPGSNWGIEADAWDIEENGAFIVARLRAERPAALVMRRMTDGSLRLDPGPCELQRAVFFRARPEGFEGGASPSGYQKQIRGDDGLILTIRRHFQDNPRCVSYGDDSVLVTSAWTFGADTSGSIAMTGFTWSAGDRRGLVKVVWTDAVIKDETLVFPLSRYAYTVTMRLEGVPSGRGIVLHVDGMTIHDLTGQDIVFAMNFTLSGRPYPDPEAPELETTASTATVDLADP